MRQFNSTSLMKKALLFLAIAFIGIIQVKAQISTSVTMSGSPIAGSPFTTFAAAITAVNGLTITGPVVVNATAGSTETLSGTLLLTATGTSANTITIQRSGAGANPQLISYTGTSTSTATPDGMFILRGSDYVTIDGIDLFDNAANTNATTQMEVGYGMFKNSGTDGCNNNTIKNCTVTLRKAAATSNFCIYAMNALWTAAATAITVTSTSGANSNNLITNNTTVSGGFGIQFTGFTDATLALADLNNTVTNNTITDFSATAAAVGNGSYGIAMGGQQNVVITGNTITSSSTVKHAGHLGGIWFQINSGNATIRKNLITVHGGSTTAYIYGIRLQGGASASTINVDSNKIYNSTYTTLTTSAGGFYGIQSGSTIATLNITNDTISNNAIGGTALSSGTNHLIAVNTGTVATVNILRNVINNNSYGVSTATATGTSYAIFNSVATSTALNIKFNSISNLSRTGTSGGTTIGIYNSATITNQFIDSNTVDNITIDGTGTTSTMYGIQTGTGNVRIRGNTVSNIKCLKASGTGLLYGIYNIASPTNEEYNNNTIFNINHSGTGTTYGMIFNTVTGTRTVNDNIVYNVSTAGTTVAGISNTTSSPTVLRNKVYDISSSSTGAPTVSGIIVSTLGTSGVATLRNNLIGNLSAPNAGTATALAPTLRGINLTVSTASTSIFVDYNTVYISGTSGGANFGATAIYHTGSSTSTTANLTMRNNIFYNDATPTGVGIVSAFARGIATATNYNAASDRNIYYGGSPSSNQLIYYDGTNSSQDVANFNTVISGTMDDNSYEENVAFQSTTGSSSDFLQFDVSIASAAESGAANIAGVTNDYATTIRQGNAGYAGTGSAPDVGAWEIDGTALGGCSGAPDPSSALTSNASPCSGANFTLSLDVVFGLGYALQWEISTTGAGGTYTPISGASSSTLVTNTLVDAWYRCAVTCVASAQTTNSVEVAIDVTTLSGVYTIDNTSGDYTSFGAAIADLSCKGVSGPVTFNVTAGQTFVETADLNLTFSGTSTNTIQFVKNGAGANPIIQKIGTSGTSDYIVKFNGVDYYTFNGIDFQQTGTSSTDWVEYGVWITNASATDGAKNNTIKNGTITLTNTYNGAKGGYISSFFTPTSLAGTQSENVFENITISNSFEGYRITGSSTTYLDNGNEIRSNSGVSAITNLGDGTATGALYGVFATHQTNFKLKGTTISNLTANGTSLMYGITLQTSALNSAEISGNTFNGFTGGGTMYGIYFSQIDTADVFDNKIYNFVDNTTAAASVRGIYVAATGANVNIYNNTIYDLLSNGLTGTTVAGIDLGTGIFNVYNNMISDLRAPASTTTTGGTRGISITGGTTSGVDKIYHNTIYLNDVATVASYTSAGIHNSSTTPILDIRNNVVVNNSDISSFGTRVVAFWKTSSTDNVDNASNNNLYYAGTPDATHLIYYNGTTGYQTIPTYFGASEITPAEALSQTENVVFATISNGILRPDGPSTVTVIESGAQSISGFTSDFDGDSRSGYPLAAQSGNGGFSPDMGADEGDFGFYTPPVPDCATYNSPADATTGLCSYSPITLSWTPAATGGSVTGGYDVYFGTSATPGFVTNTSSTNYAPTGLLPNTTYYWQIIPKNASGDATGCSIFSFTTTDASITSVTGDTRCGTGVVNLSVVGSGTLNWYTTPTGGTPINTGATYSPTVSTTTDYYVAGEALGTPIITGRTASSNPGTATTLTNYGSQFVVTEPITLNSVDVFSGTGTSITIALYNSTGTTQLLTNGAYATPAGVQTTVPLSWSIQPGTYRLGVIGMTGSYYRENSGPVYPIALGTSGSIQGFFSSLAGSLTTSASYYFTYNWNITPTCSSPRMQVTATVTAPPSLTLSASSASTCAGTATSSPITVTSTIADFDTYTWSPSTGVTGTTSATFAPSTTTTYTLNASNTTTGCSNVATVSVTAIPLPSAPTTTGYNLCLNATIPFGDGLEATPGSSTTSGSQVISFDVSSQPTETNAAPGNTVASATMTALPAGATVTSVVINYNGIQALSNSWDSDVKLGLGGAIVNAASQSTGVLLDAPGTFNYSRTATTGSTITTSGGTVDLLYWDDFNDNVGDETIFPTGTGVATVTINYTYPLANTINWFTASTGGSSISSSNIFDPLSYNASLNTTPGITSFYAEAYDGTCSSIRTQADLNVGATLTATSSATSTSICEGSSTTLSVAESGGGNPFTYSWDDGVAPFSTAASVAVTPTSTTTYTVTVSDACGATTTTTITITVNPLPTLVVTPTSGVICNPGGTAVSLSATGGGTYAWAPSTGLSATTGASVNANPSVSTTYTTTCTDGNGCIATSTVVINVAQAITSLNTTGTSTSVCEGAAITLASAGVLSGYQMNAAGSETFNDINSTGTSVGSLTDDSEHNISMPAFTFNGVSYTTARVGTNGVIVLGSSSGDISTSNAALPSTSNSAGNIFIAPFWDDLDVNMAGTIKTQTVGSKFIIQFNGLDHNNYTTGNITFQVQLDNSTGEIHFVYDDVTFGDVLYDAGASATVGIQYSSSSALQYSLNSASLTTGQCITFTPNTLTYGWTGPNAYTAATQNASVNPSVSASAGTYTVTATSGAGCTLQSTVAVTVNPTSVPTSVGTYTNTSIHTDGTTRNYIDGSCNFIASIQDAIGGNVLGSTSSSTEISSSIIIAANNLGYIPRVYTITPSSNGSATVTLYYSQGEFDTYNASNGTQLDIATGPSDFTGIGNIRLRLATGGNINTGTLTTITPSVSWNATASQWEITATLSEMGMIYLFGEPTCTNIITGINATSVTNSTATINWDASGATQWSFRFKPTASATWNNTGISGTNSKNLVGLASNTSYDVQIRAICSPTSYGSYSSFSFTTSGVICLTPTGLASGSITQSSASLSWNAVSGVSNYAVRFKLSSSSTWTNSSSSTNSFAMQGLQSNQSYDVQVAAHCANGLTAYTTTHSFTTLTNTCTSPANFATNSLTMTSFNLTWDAVGSATSYSIRIKPNGASVWNNTSSVTNSRTFVGLMANTLYDVEVRTNCSNGASSYSSTQVQTSANTCTAPTNISYTSLGVTNVTVNWDVVASASSYAIRIKPNSSAIWNNTSSATNTRTFTGLTPNTLYDIEIRSNCAGLASAYSSSQFTTNASNCLVPTNLTNIASTSTSTTITWDPVPSASSYVIRFKQNSSGTWINTSSITNSKVLAGLTSGVLYDVEVRSNCSADNSAFSSTLNFTLGGAKENSGATTSLYNFNGLKTPQGNSLSWSTLSENKNKEFILEHSLDGKNYIILAKVSSQADNGVSESVIQYSFIHKEPSATVNHYRLRSIGWNGESVLYPFTVILDNIASHTVSVYPNPTHDLITVEYSTDRLQTTKVKVLDMTGRVVKTVEALPQAGEHQYTLSLSELSAGMYTVQVYTDDKLSYVTKVQKQD